MRYLFDANLCTNQVVYLPVTLLHFNTVTTHLLDASLVWESGATSEFLLQFSIYYPPQSIVYPPPTVQCKMHASLLAVCVRACVCV